MSVDQLENTYLIRTRTVKKSSTLVLDRACAQTKVVVQYKSATYARNASYYGQFVESQCENDISVNTIIKAK